MDMIAVLKKKKKEMKNLRQREEKRDNKAVQDAIDRKFKSLTEQIHQLMIALRYAKDYTQFQLDDKVLSDLEELLIYHKRTVHSGYADRDNVNRTEIDFKDICQNIKKQWTKHYIKITDKTNSTLKVISKIDSARVSKCLNDIGKGADWTTNVDNFETINKSLSEAKKLIDDLGLDQEIITFLQKMNNGRATILDLDEKVIGWLKKESLESRVKLTFISRGNRT
nr:hypothetical protein [uncultured Anaerostipes sp.]